MDRLIRKTLTGMLALTVAAGTALLPAMPAAADPAEYEWTEDDFAEILGEGEPVYEEPVYEEPSVSTGQTVLFGRYEQNNKPEDGTEPIEWQVLAVQDGKALLLARYGLDAQSFGGDSQWSSSSLKSWLNNDFLYSAFDDGQRSYLAGGSGDAAGDLVSVLGSDEVGMYASGMMQCSPTDSAYVKLGGDPYSCAWWLRSMGQSGSGVSIVDAYGSMDVQGYPVDGIAAVRPAVWVYTSYPEWAGGYYVDTASLYRPDPAAAVTEAVPQQTWKSVPTYYLDQPMLCQVVNTGGSGMFLMSAAAAESDILSMMNEGDLFTVQAIEDGWAYGDYNGMIGWAYYDSMNLQPYQEPAPVSDPYTEGTENWDDVMAPSADPAVDPGYTEVPTQWEEVPPADNTMQDNIWEEPVYGGDTAVVPTEPAVDDLWAPVPEQPVPADPVLPEDDPWAIEETTQAPAAEETTADELDDIWGIPTEDAAQPEEVQETTVQETEAQTTAAEETAAEEETTTEEETAAEEETTAEEETSTEEETTTEEAVEEPVFSWSSYAWEQAGQEYGLESGDQVSNTISWADIAGSMYWDQGRSGAAGAQVMDFNRDGNEDMMLYYFAPGEAEGYAASQLYAKLYTRNEEADEVSGSGSIGIMAVNGVENTSAAAGVQEINGVNYVYTETYSHAQGTPGSRITYTWYAFDGYGFEKRWELTAQSGADGSWKISRYDAYGGEAEETCGAGEGFEMIRSVLSGMGIPADAMGSNPDAAAYGENVPSFRDTGAMAPALSYQNICSGDDPMTVTSSVTVSEDARITQPAETVTAS